MRRLKVLDSRQCFQRAGLVRSLWQLLLRLMVLRAETLKSAPLCHATKGS